MSESAHREAAPSGGPLTEVHPKSWGSSSPLMSMTDATRSRSIPQRRHRRHVGLRGRCSARRRPHPQDLNAEHARRADDTGRHAGCPSWKARATRRGTPRPRSTPGHRQLRIIEANKLQAPSPLRIESSVSRARREAVLRLKAADRNQVALRLAELRSRRPSCVACCTSSSLANSGSLWRIKAIFGALSDTSTSSHPAAILRLRLPRLSRGPWPASQMTFEPRVYACQLRRSSQVETNRIETRRREKRKLRYTSVAQQCVAMTRVCMHWVAHQSKRGMMGHRPEQALHRCSANRLRDAGHLALSHTGNVRLENTRVRRLCSRFHELGCVAIQQAEQASTWFHVCLFQAGSGKGGRSRLITNDKALEEEDVMSMASQDPGSLSR